MIRGHWDARILTELESQSHLSHSRQRLAPPPSSRPSFVHRVPGGAICQRFCRRPSISAIFGDVRWENVNNFTVVNASQRSIPQQMPPETQATPLSLARKNKNINDVLPVVQTPHERRMMTEERTRALTCRVREDPCHSKSSGRVDRSLLRNLPEKCFERLTWRICSSIHPENFTISTPTFGSKTFSTISARDIEHCTPRFIAFNLDAKDVTSTIGSADSLKKCTSASRISSTKLARRVRNLCHSAFLQPFFRRKAVHQRYLPRSLEQDCARSERSTPSTISPTIRGTRMRAVCSMMR